MKFKWYTQAYIIIIFTENSMTQISLSFYFAIMGIIVHEIKLSNECLTWHQINLIAMNTSWRVYYLNW